MFIQSMTINESMIEGNNDKMTELILESVINFLLKSDESINQLKQHDDKFIMAIIHKL